MRIRCIFAGWMVSSEADYARCCAKQQKRPGLGRCYADQVRWPNAFFVDLGLFTMAEAHALAS